MRSSPTIAVCTVDPEALQNTTTSPGRTVPASKAESNPCAESPWYTQPSETYSLMASVPQ